MGDEPKMERNHDKLDAEDALRKELQLVVNRYIRRMNDVGKQYIERELAREGRKLDAITIGRQAAERAAADYFGGLAGQSPYPAIEGGATTRN